MPRALATKGRAAAEAGRAAIDALVLVPLDVLVLDAGRARSAPPSLARCGARRLSVLAGDDLGILVTYDERMLAAARHGGV